jgi:hypothetical protein
VRRSDETLPPESAIQALWKNVFSCANSSARCPSDQRQLFPTASAKLSNGFALQMDEMRPHFPEAKLSQTTRPIDKRTNMSTALFRRSLTDFLADAPLQSHIQNDSSAGENQSSGPVALALQERVQLKSPAARVSSTIAAGDRIETLSFWFFSTSIVLWWVFSSLILGNCLLALIPSIK